MSEHDWADNVAAPDTRNKDMPMSRTCVNSPVEHTLAGDQFLSARTNHLQFLMRRTGQLCETTIRSLR